MERTLSSKASFLHPRLRDMPRASRIEPLCRYDMLVQKALRRHSGDPIRPQLWCCVTTGSTTASASNASKSENKAMFQTNGAAGGAQGRNCVAHDHSVVAE